MSPLSQSLYSRRAAIKLAAAGLALSACQPAPDISRKHIAVVGAGIVGASIAYHLAKLGVKVTILDRGGVAQLASQGTFAWINATWAKQPQSYHAFNQDGLSGWEILQAELSVPIKWGGSLEWFPSSERQTRLAKQIDEQVSWGEPAEMLGRKACENLEPHVDFSGTDTVAFSPRDGALDPVLASQMLIDAAVKRGAILRTDCEVFGVESGASGETLLKTSCGDIAVDRFVLATGADPQATQSLAGLDIPQRSTPGVIVVTQPQPPLLNRILVAPGVHIHQRLDGRVVLGEQDGAPDTDAHAERLHGRPTRFPAQEFAQQHAQQILSVADQYVPGLGNAEVDDVFIGWRPLPLDGHPVLGASPTNPAAYIAIAHSGVSLAPIIGEVVARELVTGQTAKVLAEYRPNRKFERVRRY